MVGQVARSPLTFDQFVNQYSPSLPASFRVEFDGGSGICSGTVAMILIEKLICVSDRGLTVTRLLFWLTNGNFNDKFCAFAWSRNTLQ